MSERSYQTTERDVRRLLADVKGEFDPLELQEAQTYVDAGEFGLAMECICTVVKKKRIPLMIATYTDLVDLARDLDMDPEYWQELEPS